MCLQDMVCLGVEAETVCMQEGAHECEGALAGKSERCN